MNELPIPVMGVAGFKNSGKTTLVVRLVEEFARRGLRVATIKHAHHSFQIDDAETDSARHRRAGASQVAIVSGKRWAVVTELPDEDKEPSFREVLAKLERADLVLVEGYKEEAIPKIEVRRAAAPPKRKLADDDPLVVAIAADHPLDGEPVPVFELDDVSAIAGFIAAFFVLKGA